MMILSTQLLAAWFVSPWLAGAGAAAAAIPIIIHILNRRRFKTIRWAAMEYLLQAMRKNRRRLRFEHWLLLAIRCLLVLFMGMALARPLGCDNAAMSMLGGQRSALHVFVIDNSYSMGYEFPRGDAKTHLDLAKQLAKKRIDSLSSGNEAVMIITASSLNDPSRPTDPHAITPKPTYDLQGARAAIDRIEQTGAGTDMVGALQLAIRIAKEESKQQQKLLYIFTDGTKSAFEGAEGRSVDALKQLGPELSKTFISPRLWTLGKPGQWNQAVLNIKPDVNLVNTKFSTVFATEVKGFGAGPDPVLQWKLDDHPVGLNKPVKLDLETMAQALEPQMIRDGGPHVVSVSLAGEDRLKVDNTRWRIVEAASDMKVLIVEGKRNVGALQGSASFLDLALSPPKEADPDNKSGNKKTDSYVAVDPAIGEIELMNKVLPTYRAVFMANVGSLTPNQADQLKRYVEQGGTLLIFAGSQVDSKNYNEILLPRNLLPGTLVKTVSAAPNQAYHFDFNPEGALHPYLREFRKQVNTGLNTASIWNYIQIEIPAGAAVERVLDYQAQEGTKQRDPAITTHSLGRGKVVFCSTSADPEWNGLPAKPVYMPLIQELLAGSAGANDRWMNLTAGDILEIPEAIGLTAAPSLVDVLKNEIPMDSLTSAQGVTTYKSGRPLAKPGVYQLNTGKQLIPVAVNVPADEADVRVISEDAIKKAMGDIELNIEKDIASAAGMKVDYGNDLSWSLMLIVLILAGLECFCAMHFGHYKRGKRNETPAEEIGVAAK